MIAWLKTAVGSVVGILVAVLVIALIIWGYSKRDQWFANRYNQKTASSVAHGDSAKTELAAADTSHTASIQAQNEFLGLAHSPETRANPQARKVADAGVKVITKAAAETQHLRAANTQLSRQVTDLETRGPPPEPRLIPYVDPLYSFSSKHRAVPVIRLGADYRVLKWVHAKVEGSYEPPPAGVVDQRPEFRLSVGGHITFR